MSRTRPRVTATAVTALLAVGALTGCAGQAPAPAGAASLADDGPFDLEALIEAAKAEGPITIYDNTSKVEDMAAAFTAEYGIEAVGIKTDAPSAIEKVTREAQAGNVVGDVVAIPDLPALKNQLLPNGFVQSWVPADIAPDIDPRMSDPLVLITDPGFWTYNTEVYDTCPIDNVWELTEPEWTGKVAFEDPVGDSGTLDWFSQLSHYGDDEMRAAYEAHFGEALVTEHDSATAEWVARLARNVPALATSSEEVSEAVGARGQSAPPIGFMASAKYRNIEEKDYALGACEGLEPWVGKAAPKGIAIASGTASPNAAKLYVHFALTEQGIAPQIGDGKISSNSAIVQPEDPARVGELRDELFFFDNDGLDAAWGEREQWQDLWRMSRG